MNAQEHRLLFDAIAGEARKAKNRAYYAKYRADHPELKEYYSDYYRAHKDKWTYKPSVKAKLRNKVYREERRAEIAAKKKAYRALNHEKVRAQEKASAARRRTFDHLIPVVRHGAHAEWNLMLAHDRCNKRRGTTQILPAETKDAALAYIAARCEALAHAS